ncbi:UPF0565 protein C2orf69 homolog isoform X2 [Agrilus planipennis]|uniref:UPF0565 protein C2orf69 homolog isoform X2 n=1 Tax=Agrilus planipennis TaxID=224129 RepID=A0A1W4WWU3_AGRPL|nr:UPF0565 protein C2orf69 homolog isoform X2 [Agrilus planipennis]
MPYSEYLYVTCMNMSGGVSPEIRAFRLRNVDGYGGRTNDVVYCPPATPSSEPSTVVFFGGDVQDFPENMQSHRDHKHYIKWNLEDTGRLIRSQFQDCHVVVVRPYRIEYKTFSSFENFVPCNNCGVPEHTPMHFALQHLEKLLEMISERLETASIGQLEKLVCNNSFLCQDDSTENELQFFRNSLPSSTSIEVSSLKNLNPAKYWWREGIKLHKNNLILIGFSKGCVVLNQFLYEFHYLKTLTPDDNTSMSIVSRIKDMYWLDGGHSGGKNTWITSRSLLETLTRLGIRVHVRVTPYQITDDRRPWIKKEEKMFTEMLQKLGANIDRSVHFESSLPNLYTHFDVLTVINPTN